MSRDITIAGQKVTQVAANQCVLNVAEQTIANICRPTKLLMKLKSSSFDASPFSVAGQALMPQYGSAAQNALDPNPVFSGARTGVTFEGPFMKYSIAPGSTDWADPDKLRIGGINTSADTMDFFFDLTGNRVMLLPYPGKLSVITQYPGLWTFEYFLLESAHAMANAQLGHIAPTHEHMLRRGAPLESDATLTLRLAPKPATNTSRSFAGIPFGAHSYSYHDSSGGAPTGSTGQETTSLADKGTTPDGSTMSTLVNVSLAATAVQGAFMTRIGHMNAQNLLISSAASVTGFLQWHLSFV